MCQDEEIRLVYTTSHILPQSVSFAVCPPRLALLIIMCGDVASVISREVVEVCVSILEFF